MEDALKTLAASASEASVALPCLPVVGKDGPGRPVSAAGPPASALEVQLTPDDRARLWRLQQLYFTSLEVRRLPA